MRYFCTTLALLAVGCGPSLEAPTSDVSYLERRAEFQTTLHTRGPAPQEWEPEQPPEGVREIIYPSGEFQLKAWVYTPKVAASERRPALVFFHGGFAFGGGDLYECHPFMDAGFVVMAPMLRGENGNPGSFELLLGEVDNAQAAVKWLATQPEVDSARIYAFGHSIGGGVAAMLSLLDDVPIRHCGSSGGLYGPDVFHGWSDFVPFDPADKGEQQMRVLLGSIRWMQHRHHAYLGVDDMFDVEMAQARQEMAGRESMLELYSVPGDHFSSFQPALVKYLELIHSENDAPD